MASSGTEKLSSNNLLIVMLLITFLVVGVAALVSKALIGTIALDNRVLKAKNTANTNVQADVKAAPDLMDAFSALGPQAGLIADALPNTTDFPGLIVALENMSNDAGVKLKSVAPATVGLPGTVTAPVSTSTDASEPATPQPYDFTITTDGRYDTILKMLDHIEKSARPMRVLSMQLTGSGSTLGGNFTVETYFQDKAQLPFSTETIK